MISDRCIPSLFHTAFAPPDALASDRSRRSLPWPLRRPTPPSPPDERSCARIAITATTPPRQDPAPVAVAACARHRCTLRPVSAPLFGPAGPQPADVQQGGVANASLMAVLAALAHALPQRLQAQLRPEEDGSIQVLLYCYPHLWSRGRTPFVMRVEPTFPTDIATASPIYAAPAPRQPALWPLVLERALAQREGGYEALAALDAERALALLTGQEAVTHRVADWSAAQMDEWLGAATRARWPVVAVARTLSLAAGALKARARCLGLISGHAYTLLDMEPQQGTLVLHNPWGHSHLPALSLDDFQRLFRTVSAVPR